MCLCCWRCSCFGVVVVVGVVLVCCVAGRVLFWYCDGVYVFCCVVSVFALLLVLCLLSCW